MMSGGFLYPPTTEDADAAILFIETSGCLPMCGHGTIGIITLGIEHGLLTPKTQGEVLLDAPAGRIRATYDTNGVVVNGVRIYNVPSFLAASDVVIDVPGLGELKLDVSYGGNFYAIVEPQENYPGLDKFNASDIMRWSPVVRALADAAVSVIHPEDPTIAGVSHVLWTDKPKNPDAHARNAVFYGDKAIDRSPCGTGTSARMAQLFARGELSVHDDFVHESYIGSLFEGRVEGVTKLGGVEAILPSIYGWARLTGHNTIFVDDRDPFKNGFQVL